MTVLPPDFQFSQSSLQDFETCPRRFELRYLWQLRWPAIEAEPVQETERMRRLGVDFHRVVHQHLVGLDEQRLRESLDPNELELHDWWQNYLAQRPNVLTTASIYPELPLSTPLGGFRLLARFDVLAVQSDGTFLIIDWKTAPKKPERQQLARRWQTRVYPYVLAAAGAAYNNGQPIDPTAIQMMYWYPQVPDAPEIFTYGTNQFQKDEQALLGLIKQIKLYADDNTFPLVEETKPCSHCVYRSFCDRGDKAGDLLDFETDDTEDITDVLAQEWDQIAEIQF